MNPVVDVAFNIRGRTLPLNNGYPLYAAISKFGGCHLDENIGIHSIGSKDIADGVVYLNSDSRLRFRTTADHVKSILKLAGKRLEVDGHVINVGVPHITAVQPASTLYSRIVTYKRSLDEVTFLTTTLKKLADLQVEAEMVLPLFLNGPLKGEYQRRVVHIKGKKILGFGLTLKNLSPEDSMKILTHGLGGRRHMGCGIFSPVEK
jgi:CRISPR-associated protein Cas6